MTNTQFEKMVKAEKFQFIATLVGEENAEVVAFLEQQAEMVLRKNAKKSETRTLSKTQKENAELVEQITSVLSEKKGEIFTAQEVMEMIGKSEFTAQKASALMKKATETGLVEKAEEKKEKRVAYKSVEEGE